MRWNLRDLFWLTACVAVGLAGYCLREHEVADLKLDLSAALWRADKAIARECEMSFRSQSSDKSAKTAWAQVRKLEASLWEMEKQAEDRQTVIEKAVQRFRLEQVQQIQGGKP